MTVPERHMLIALTVSTLLVVFNIFAVTSGDAGNYYHLAEQLISSFIHALGRA